LLLGVSDQSLLRPIAPVVIVGGITSAATTGALVAIGRRLGSSGIPFAAISAALFHRTAAGGEAGLVFGGLVLHVTVMFVLASVCVWLVTRLRLSKLVAAVIVALGELALSWLVAWSRGAGVATILPLGDRIVLALVTASALVVGMRFALPSLRNA
jgi:hypothetical protein